MGSRGAHFVVAILEREVRCAGAVAAARRVAPKAVTFGAPGTLPPLGSPWLGRFRKETREDR